MDCRSASAADCVPDCGEGVQWPNERNPIFFMQDKSRAFLIIYGASDVGSIPIVRSTTHDVSIALTRLTYLNPAGKWTVLNPNDLQRKPAIRSIVCSGTRPARPR